MTENIEVSIDYRTSHRCSIVVPNVSAVRSALGLIGNACGASKREVQALIVATEFIAKQRSYCKDPENPLADPEAWRWGDWSIEKAHEYGIYSSEVAWANTLDYCCWPTDDNRIHMAGIEFNGKPLPYAIFGGYLGILTEAPTTESTIRLTSSMKSSSLDEVVLPLEPLFIVIQEVLREACICLVGSQISEKADRLGIDHDESEPLNWIESPEQFAAFVASACRNERQLEVCEDTEYHKPRYLSLANDGMTLEVQLATHDDTAFGEPPLRSVDSRFGDDSCLHLSLWEPAWYFVLNIILSARHPYEATNNAAFRELTEKWASAIRREYEAYKPLADFDE